jgi:hypothetical protein
MISSSILASERPTQQPTKTAESHFGTTTNWLSMITPPPTVDSRCGTHLWNPDGELHTLIAFDPNLELAANMTCLPAVAAEWYNQKKLPYGAENGTVTSLGPMECPAAYTTASTSQKDEHSTLIFCCPSNYQFATPADYGSLFGCTSLQTEAVTVHNSSTTTTLSPGPSARAREVAGIAVNGWVFKSTDMPTAVAPGVLDPSALPTETAKFTPDMWAREHLGMTTAQFSGIILGVFAGIVILIFVIYAILRRRFCPVTIHVKQVNAEETGDGEEDIRRNKLEYARREAEFDPRKDVELSDLESNGASARASTRVPSSSTVRHYDVSEFSKRGGSCADEERTA